jgi:ParB family chromosome partitioning protein
LNVVEEALAYKRLVDEFKLTHEGIAARVGKDRSTVSNVMRLLLLPFKVRDALAAGQVSPGHARALLSMESRRRQVEICERIVKEGLSVRAVERLCGAAKPKPPRAAAEKDIHVRELEESLQEYLGTKVHIREPKGGPGQVVIEYFSAEDLDRVAKRIRGSVKGLDA